MSGKKENNSGEKAVVRTYPDIHIPFIKFAGGKNERWSNNEPPVSSAFILAPSSFFFFAAFPFPLYFFSPFLSLSTILQNERIARTFSLSSFNLPYLIPDITASSLRERRIYIMILKLIKNYQKFAY